MNDRAHARARNPVDTVVKAYNRALRAEEQKPDTEPLNNKGRRKQAGRRACERVADEMDYNNWKVVHNIVIRYERIHMAKLETFGMELDPEFSRGVRLIQDSVDKLLEACDLLTEGVKDLETGDTIAGQVEDIRRQLAVERPGILCPFCKGVVDDCPECEGDGWWDSLEGLGDIDLRLKSSDDIHVQVDGEVVTLDAFEEGL